MPDASSQPPPQTQANIFYTHYTISHTDFRKRWLEDDANFYMHAHVCIFLRTRSRAFSLFSKTLWPPQCLKKSKKIIFSKSSESKNAHLCLRRQLHVLERAAFEPHYSCFNLASTVSELTVQIPSQSSVSKSLCLKWHHNDCSPRLIQLWGS